MTRPDKGGAVRPASAPARRPARAARPQLPWRQQAVDLAGLDALAADSLGLFVWSDARPLAGVAALVDWRICGALSQAILSALFVGAAGDALLLPVGGRFGPRRLFVFGLGAAATADEATMRRGCRQALEVMQQAGVQAVSLGAAASRTQPALEAAFVRAARLEGHGEVALLLTEAGA